MTGALHDFAELSGHLAAEDHEEALKATNCHAWCRFLPLAGELEVVTICPDFFCVLRAIFYDAIKCLFSITVSGFVARIVVRIMRRR